jgi:branched-chain amino acid aminotransferase
LSVAEVTSLTSLCGSYFSRLSNKIYGEPTCVTTTSLSTVTRIQIEGGEVTTLAETALYDYDVFNTSKESTDMTAASTHAWFNGDIVARETGAPSVASINFHLGTGVFDGLMAYWNDDHYYLHRVEEHLVRFREGAARMGLHVPWSVSQLLTGINELLRQEPQGTQYVRPIAYRREPELWVTGNDGRPVDVSVFTVRVQRELDNALACQLSPIERVSSRAIPAHTKVSGAYVNSFYARKTAERAGYQDGLMLDREGRLAEASAANVFVIIGDRLVTPPINPDVFPGITRAVVLELARGCGIDAEEANLGPAELRGIISGAFLCSTLMEIRPLNRIDDVPLDTVSQPVYTNILKEFRKLVHG